MFPAPDINAQSDVPLYRQVFQQLKDSIHCGKLSKGAKLPATRELAGLLGLNRTTISAAYELLESEGLISGQVGRGSFVTGAPDGEYPGIDWRALLAPSFATPGAAAPEGRIPPKLRRSDRRRRDHDHSAVRISRRIRPAAAVPDRR